MSYFSERQLKHEVKLLDEEVFKLKEEAIVATANHRAVVQDREKQESEINKLTKDLREVKKLVRDQTGADLLVNALQELGVVPKPKKTHNCYNEAARLQAQMSGLQSLGMQRQAGLANALGGSYL